MQRPPSLTRLVVRQKYWENYSDGRQASLLKYTDVSKRVVKGTGEFAKHCLYDEKT